MEKEIIRLIGEKGPLIGTEIWKLLGGDGLALWRTCKLSQKIEIKTACTRYMRLDRRVAGFARISPSIFREFLTYSIIGLPGDIAQLENKTRHVASHIQEVSRSKAELAFQTIYSLANNLDSEISLEQKVCFILAGDIVYNMAHDVPRPERSTKKPVNGSDMDIVVIMDDLCPESLKKRLDDTIYREKVRLLITPHIKEELDYIVKKMERVREQVHFDTFKHMVACKILQEGTLLYGSESIFHNIKVLLKSEGVTQKLEKLEKKAREFRLKSEKYLLYEPLHKIKEESLAYFYPTEESEEFE